MLCCIRIKITLTSSKLCFACDDSVSGRQRSQNAGIFQLDTWRLSCYPRHRFENLLRFTLSYPEVPTAWLDMSYSHHTKHRPASACSYECANGTFTRQKHHVWHDLLRQKSKVVSLFPKTKQFPLTSLVLIERCDRGHWLHPESPSDTIVTYSLQRRAL